jgi:VIT1/CCC1 family predicted Fe2+/Mn2+ transporter
VCFGAFSVCRCGAVGCFALFRFYVFSASAPAAVVSSTAAVPSLFTVFIIKGKVGQADTIISFLCGY